MDCKLSFCILINMLFSILIPVIHPLPASIASNCAYIDDCHVSLIHSQLHTHMEGSTVYILTPMKTHVVHALYSKDYRGHHPFFSVTDRQTDRQTHEAIA